MKNLVLFFCLSPLICLAQFDGPGGTPGSKSIHKDALEIVNWASGTEITRGNMQVNDTSLGKPSVGTLSDCLGEVDGGVLSLGDGGEVILSFKDPIVNRTGYEIAVFENGFAVGLSYYLELAHVEVSNDGENWVRFPSEVAIDTTYQTNNFSYTKPEEVYNLAGKHQAPYGTLFDLEEVGLDTANYVKIIDVVGSLNDSFGTRDSKGTIINDPWPSPFESGGFDLDAVAVVNGPLLSLNKVAIKEISVVPSLAKVNQQISISENAIEVSVYNSRGTLVCKTEDSTFSLKIPGIYTLSAFDGETRYIGKICVY